MYVSEKRSRMTFFISQNPEKPLVQIIAPSRRKEYGWFDVDCGIVNDGFFVYYLTILLVEPWFFRLLILLKYLFKKQLLLRTNQKHRNKRM